MRYEGSNLGMWLHVIILHRGDRLLAWTESKWS